MARIMPSAPALLPAGAAVALFVVWMASEGGYPAGDWYLGIFVLAGLLCAVLFGLGRHRPSLSRAATFALIALSAYTAWSFSSILWADSQGVALEGANRTLLFLLAYALFAVLPWRDAGPLVLLAGFALAVAVIGAVTTWKLGFADEPGRLFIDSRLASPIGYQNGNAAMWTMGALAGLVLACRRSLPVPLRAVMLAAAGMAIELGVLAQSRGWLVALPVSLLIAFVLVPDRVRLLGAATLVAVAVLPAVPALLDVYDAGRFQTPAAAAEAIAREAPGAAGAILLTALALTAVGALVALTDRRRALPAATVRQLRRGVAALVLAAVVAGAAAALVAIDGDLVGRIDSAWEEFSDVNPGDDPENANRFGSLGTSRYDFWRVALDVSLDHPLAGTGQDNYAADYLARRRTLEEPRWVHSLPLRLTTHTGLVGLALFLAFAAATFAGALRRDRSGEAADRMIRAGLLLPFVVWLVHGSVDWLWEIPGLTAPALALAATAVAAAAQGSASTPRAGGAWRRTAPAVAAVAAVAVAVAAAGPPWLAERQMAAALDGWRDDPADALARLDDAASLNPLGARADLSAGLIASRAGAPRESERRFARAVERDPVSWFALLEVGLAASARDDDATARRRLLVARALNPREPVIRSALDRLGSSRPLTARQVEQELLERAFRRIGRFGR